MKPAARKEKLMGCWFQEYQRGSTHLFHQSDKGPFFILMVLGCLVFGLRGFLEAAFCMSLNDILVKSVRNFSLQVIAFVWLDKCLITQCP